ncbi:MAG: metal ABC transporter permease [Bacteroidales bacterium]|jgi:iron/zinc/copper transport system permease protein|nr:metal ABC transporter permease [Bacteroidales bacterium]MDD3700529.1 metal ABC transporter permease [Bacteroidales bacterium]MDY0370491.1 metal ABC transporter permease [Bacteroidales bacterium]
MGQSFFEFFRYLSEYAFLQNALSVSIVLSVAYSIVGCFIVLRGLALMGDAISHAVLPGVAISYLLQISYFVGAVVFGLMAALGIGFVKENSKIKSDSSIGIVFSAFLALGILLVTKIQSSVNLNNILFGNVLTITNEDRILTYVVSGIVLLAVALFYKELLLTTFDETMAKASGLPVKFINYMVMIMLTLITVVSLQTVGVILVVSLLITPAATAYLLTNNLSSMLWVSTIIGVVSAIIGLYLSATYNLPSGVVMVLAVSCIFVLVFLFNRKTGLVWKKLRLRI